MKKYFYYFLLPLCLGFVSCGGNDEQPTNTENPTQYQNSDLIGWWISQTARTPEYRGDIKTYYPGLHFMDDNAVEVIDITTESQWFLMMRMNLP